MADNYLETKFEEYAARKAGRMPRRTVALSQRRGYAEFRFPRRRVLVLNGLTPGGQAIIHRFRRVDCQVAFCASDTIDGQHFAELAGARFHAVDLNNAEEIEAMMRSLFHDWGDIDILVSLAADDVTAAAVDCLADFRQNGPVPNDYCRIFAFTDNAERLTRHGLPAKCFAPTMAGDERIPSLLVLLSTEEASPLIEP